MSSTSILYQVQLQVQVLLKLKPKIKLNNVLLYVQCMYTIIFLQCYIKSLYYVYQQSASEVQAVLFTL